MTLIVETILARVQHFEGYKFSKSERSNFLYK